MGVDEDSGIGHGDPLADGLVGDFKAVDCAVRLNVANDAHIGSCRGAGPSRAADSIQDACGEPHITSGIHNGIQESVSLQDTSGSQIDRATKTDGRGAIRILRFL